MIQIQISYQPIVKVRDNSGSKNKINKNILFLAKLTFRTKASQCTVLDSCKNLPLFKNNPL